MSFRTTVLPAGLHSSLKYRVFLHRSQKSLLAAHRKLSKYADRGIVAFWNNSSSPTASIMGDMHFCRSNADTSTIMHEAFHACLFLARRMWLSLDSREAEELIVETQEYMVRDIRKFISHA